MKDLLLKNGVIVNHDSQVTKDVLIKDSTINRISDSIEIKNDHEVIDCTGLLVFPGMVDAHTHMGVPIKAGHSADDFESGSRSALNGGVTTIVDFTVLRKDQTLIESVKERRRLAEKAVIDVGLHCNVTRFDEDILKDIPRIRQMGINSFKVFTTYKEADMMLTYSQIEELAKIIYDNDGILMVHSEDDNVIQKASQPLIASNLSDPKYHSIARPSKAEVVAVSKIAEISNRTKCKTYIVHLNTAEGLRIANEIENMLIETCPQYLLLNDTYYDREDGIMFVASPPLRKPEDSEALWNGIIDGSVDVIATDHCPFMVIDKQKDIPFQDIPNGVGGVETMFPVMLNQFIERSISLTRLVELMSYNPAQIFNCDLKGKIAVGYDADLVIVDPNNSQKNWSENLVSKTDWNAYTDYDAIFPLKVIKS